MNNVERAQTLIEALPYIQSFYGKSIVIKYGGNAMISPELFDAVMEDIVLLRLVGIRVVLVHGGGPERNEMLKKISKKAEFINGLRYTDKETMDVVQSILCGKVNKDLVSTISRQGGRALGLCGLDGAMFKAKKLDKGDGC
ncbi:MAG: acetylglutamate kinase, partial [Oscillospiraceae bacterium]|nr:acetylglutamate kinase [Oscillospiraceae bacterium]